VFSELKVASWTYERPRCEKRKYTGNNTWQVAVKMLTALSLTAEEETLPREEWKFSIFCIYTPQRERI
jgi:hypothetical protein